MMLIMKWAKMGGGLASDVGAGHEGRKQELLAEERERGGVQETERDDSDREASGGRGDPNQENLEVPTFLRTHTYIYNTARIWVFD